MRSSVVAASMMLAAGLFLAWGPGSVYPFLDSWQVVSGVLVYAVGAIWWIVLQAAATRRLGLHLLLVWLPAAAPTWPLVHAVQATNVHDSAALAVLLHTGPAVFALLTSAVGALAILDRILFKDEKTMRDQHSDQ